MADKQRLRIVGKDLTFTRIKKSEVPHGRKGKHHAIVAEILQDLLRLRPGEALEVPRTAFGSQKLENIRAALNRLAKKSKLTIGTSSGEDNFYVWLEGSAPACTDVGSNRSAG